MTEVILKCACGKLQGKTDFLTPSLGTRIVCCCIDCQAFAQFLKRESSILDEYGGTDIFQMPISMIKVNEGLEQIACMKLSSKGLYRWYAKCCNTPIGNTMGADSSFIGVIHSFMEHESTRDNDLGESMGYVEVKDSKKSVPAEQTGSVFKIVLRSIFKLTLWKVRGLNKPSVFFDDDGNPIVKPRVVA